MLAIASALAAQSVILVVIAGLANGALEGLLVGVEELGALADEGGLLFAESAGDEEEEPAPGVAVVVEGDDDLQAPADAEVVGVVVQVFVPVVAEGVLDDADGLRVGCLDVLRHAVVVTAAEGAG